MLRRFLYLDDAALTEYVTALEGGLTTEATTRSTRSGSAAAGVDAKLVRASGERARENEETRTFSDTPESRFDRLLRAGAATPEDLGWVEVVQPDIDLADIGVGAMISWECEVFVPDIIQTLARSGEAMNALSTIQELLPLAADLGLKTDGLPSRAEMRAASRFISGIGASLLVVGEDDDTEWRVAGRLEDSCIRGSMDGRARIVGKVSSVVQVGQWKPYVTFPGMNLLPRDERRKLERQPPASGKEAEYLPGPAVMLDVLAVYR